MSSWKSLSVEIEEHSEPAATVYKLGGVLTDTHEAFEFLEKVREGLAKGPELHVLDLTEVPHMTSAGVGIIAAAFTTSKRENKKLVLAAPSTRAEQILKVVGLWDMIGHYDTLGEALTS